MNTTTRLTQTANQAMQNEVHVHPGGTTFAGKDAVNLFRAITLKSSMRLWQATGMIPTRGVGIKQMLAIAEEYTGKKYRRSQVEQAILDVDHWIGVMKSALPVTIEGDRKSGGVGGSS